MPDGLPAGYLGRVLDGNGAPVGTCWVAARGLLVTARHVIAEAAGTIPAVWDPEDPEVPGSSVTVEPMRPGVAFPPTTAHVVGLDATSDLAILRISTGTWPCAVPAVAASDPVTIGEPLALAGYAVLEDPARAALAYWETAATWSGAAVHSDGTRLGVLAGSGALPGLSGSPVIRRADGAVVGQVSGRYNSADGWARDSVWVSRIEDLDLVWSSSGLASLPVSGRVELQEPAEVLFCIDATRVSLSCPQLGIDASAPHDGFTHRLRSLAIDVERARGLRPHQERHGSDEATVSRDSAALTDLRRHMENAFVRGDVRAALTTVLAEAQRVTMPVHLAIEVEAAALARLPWEALSSPDAAGVDRPLALHPLVTAFRRVAGGARGRQVPGPLRIAVAIASPIAGGGALLDYERELRNVLTAVKGARAGQAEVRVIPFATPGAIRATLDEGDIHILHISGHAAPGVLALEDENGREVLVDAAKFVDQAIPAGKMPPVVTLAACSTNVATTSGDAAPSFAAGLVAAGCPTVVATEASISDRYATAIFAQMYRELARAQHADPVAALSRARRELAMTLAGSPDPRDAAVALLDEWAIVTVLASSAGRNLVDDKHTIPALPTPTPRPRASLGQALLALPVGDFVGRRFEQHGLRRILSGGEAGIAGVVVHGIGGIGKTTLAAELVQRTCEVDNQTLPVALTGACGTEQILLAISRRLRELLASVGILDEYLPLVGSLERGDTPWRERLGVLRASVLENMAVLLILDNFEDNLTDVSASDEYSTAQRAVRDGELAAFLAAFAMDPGRGTVLITSRFPFTLPEGAESRLLFHQLGPLSYAEAMKLVWSLPALDDLPDEDLKRVWAAVGGHPRTLETVDALLAHGVGRMPHVQERLERALTATLGSKSSAEAWLDRDRQLDAAIADAVTVAADDVVLPDLLAALSPEARGLLAALAVIREPVGEAGLLFAIGIDDPGSERRPDWTAANATVERLAGSGDIRQDAATKQLQFATSNARAEFDEAMRILSTPPSPGRRFTGSIEPVLVELVRSSLLTELDAVGGPAYYVHRWTADFIWRNPPPEAPLGTELHIRAARYWQWRVAAWPQDREADVHDLREARYHLLRAGDSDGANSVTESACSILDQQGAWDDEAALIAEQLSVLPADHPRMPAWIHQLGILAQARGDYATAEARYQQSLTINERLGNQAGMATSYHQLGILAQDRGDYATAEARYQQSLTIFERLGNQAGMATSYSQMGRLESARGDAERAASLHIRALAIRMGLGVPQMRIDVTALRELSSRVPPGTLDALAADLLPEETARLVLEAIHGSQDDAEEGGT
ncbi:MAG: tetratricopeptide repeat protein [Dermatophilaceae bacterium]